MGKATVAQMGGDGAVRGVYVGDHGAEWEIMSGGYGLAHRHEIELGFRPTLVLIREKRVGAYDVDSVGKDSTAPFSPLTQAGYIVECFIYGVGYPTFEIAGIYDRGFFVGGCRNYQNGYQNARAFKNDTGKAYEYIAFK